jgi:non-lysosomal glucosylceramidase
MASERKTYTGESLREIAFPLGGIGTGTVSLGGRGQLRDWEIFNRPGKGKSLPYTFFSIWAKPEGGEAVARIAERRFMPPYVDGRGLAPAQAYGLPRLREAAFRGQYPFAQIAFEDPALPVELRLERAWNPMIPLDDDRSGMPVAIFEWMVLNRLDRPVDLTLALSLFNACGYDGKASLESRRHGLFGQNRNEWGDDGEVRGIRMSTGKYAPEHPQFGSMALLTDWPDTTYLIHWERAGWWDDLQSFWDDFRADGLLPSRPESDPTPEGQTDVGTLGLRVRLEAGEIARLPFVLGWHFPNLVNYWNGQESVKGQVLGNHYATRFGDAWEAASTAARMQVSLHEDTERFHSTLHASTLPPEVIDAVSSQMSIIRTTTCIRTSDGIFHAFEGCNDNSGCCPMDCTHVWNYEQALAFLFPALERAMRVTELEVNTRDDGRQEFRTILPVTSEVLWGGPAAADGQMGSVLKLYREWRFSGDEAFLRRLWPDAKRALQYAWQKWDRDRDGVMEGEQHNTYDIEFYGPNTMVGTLYLAALRAAARIARHLEDEAFAVECDRLCEAGSREYDRRLWNGAFYTQDVLPPSEPAEGLAGMQSVQADGEVRYQYGPGCLSDQMLGQWFARVVGLGHVLPEERVRETLRSIHTHNFRRDFTDHASCQRTYALNDEAGLLLCTWPNGGRPRYPFPYADEVWSGIEYQVAAHMIYEGLVDEGLDLVRAVRARHDGIRRNPWDEFECGHHYARALASWSVLLALSGFDYDAVRQSITFAPRTEAAEFRCFFSTGTAWGLFSQHRRPEGYEGRIEVRYGTLTLRRVCVPIDYEDVRVALDGTDLECSAAIGALVLTLPVEVKAEQSLVVASGLREARGGATPFSESRL